MAVFPQYSWGVVRGCLAGMDGNWENDPARKFDGVVRGMERDYSVPLPSRRNTALMVAR